MGFPIPPKSGCDFCMFSKRSEFRKLFAKDPERFAQIVEMEKNSRDYPHDTLLKSGALEPIMMNQSLDLFIDDSAADEIDMCDSGHCFL